MGGREQLPVVDGLKAVACLLIVLHHLYLYGPMTYAASAVLPAVSAFLADEARMAVQVFLVLGGYLATRSLLQRPDARPGLRGMLDRYLRLAVPLWPALLLAVLCNAAADALMDHHSIGSPPQALQFLWHVLLLHDIVGVEALSAGVWYVAIDFQLALLLMLLWGLSQRLGALEPLRQQGLEPFGLLVLLLVAASVLHINLQPDLDEWAPYFWGSYGLGVLLAWHTRRGGVDRHALRSLAAVAAVIGLALLLQFRERLLLALIVAGLLAAVMAAGRLQGRTPSIVAWLSRISYAVFLVHFPVSLLVNALWWSLLPHTAAVQFMGVLLAVGASLAVGHGFHQLVELRLLGALRRRLAAVS